MRDGQRDKLTVPRIVVNDVFGFGGASPTVITPGTCTTDIRVRPLFTSDYFTRIGEFTGYGFMVSTVRVKGFIKLRREDVPPMWA
jgi:hypothetical protein